MKKITTKLIISFICLFLASCFARFPREHIPQTEISESESENYVIAYCWQDPNGKQSILSDENKEVIIVLSDIKGISRRIIQSQYNDDPNASNMVIFKNGCIADNSSLLRYDGFTLHWRPSTDELTFTEGSDWSISNIDSKLISNNNSFTDGDLKSWLLEYKNYFWFPQNLYWSYDKNKLALLGTDVIPVGTVGQNIWVAHGNPPSFTRITNIKEVGGFIANASWSNDNTKLAITYRKHSGLAIATLDGKNQLQSYVDVTREQFNELSKYWPYAFTSWLQLFYETGNIDFNSYVSVNSIPVWINNDSQIIFAASNSSDQGTLFVVDSDGTNLKPFLPDLSGLIFMPRLSADERTLAFVRYPNWKTRDKVEIATVDIYTKEISSLVVLYSQTEEDLIISGMNWSLDGKYLMFSSNHAGESDIYIITADGSAWKNITENIDGNAVGPIWKP